VKMISQNRMRPSSLPHLGTLRSGQPNHATSRLVPSLFSRLRAADAVARRPTRPTGPTRPTRPTHPTPLRPRPCGHRHAASPAAAPRHGATGTAQAVNSQSSDLRSQMPNPGSLIGDPPRPPPPRRRGLFDCYHRTL
jgi:hypothetical protein